MLCFSLLQLSRLQFFIIKRKGNVLHGHLICRYTQSNYISDIYVDGLCIIHAKNLIMKSRQFVRRYLLNDDVTGWAGYVNNG